MKTFFFIFIFTGFATSLSAQTKVNTVPSVKIEELEQIIAQCDTPMVVNFWATFCGPCIKEMPYITSITDSMGKITPVKLLYVSLDMKEDYPARVVSFLTNRKITRQCVWLNETNADHFCPKIDEKWSGSIPATLFINKKTGYRNFMEQEMSASVFRKQIALLLNR